MAWIPYGCASEHNILKANISLKIVSVKRSDPDIKEQFFNVIRESANHDRSRGCLNVRYYT